jgi:hypothetical protein
MAAVLTRDSTLPMKTNRPDFHHEKKNEKAQARSKNQFFI